MEALIENFFNLEIMIQAFPTVLRGFGITVVLCLVVIPVGLVAGLAVALLSGARNPLVKWAMVGYVDFFRAFPPLMLLIFIDMGLPFAGIDLPSFLSVVIAFMLNTSSYYGEIFRAGIESIGRGQMEAARSTGLTTPSPPRLRT